MLCDELKVYVPQDGHYGLEPEEGGKLVEEETCYLKSEVDAAIAELKKKLMPCLNGDCILTCEVVEKYGKENAELKAKLEDVQASAYAESVDAGAENLMLRRELWLARTRTARYAKMFWEKNVILNELFYFTIDYRCYEKGMKEQTLRPSEWAKVWRNVERKCRDKAEEYK
jgi:hypothetical protein